MNVSPDIEESWKVVLQNEFEKKYIKNLKQFLTNEKEKYQILIIKWGTFVKQKHY